MLRDRIAKRYAKSLYGLAVEMNLVEVLRSDMEGLASLLKQSRELQLMLASPLIREARKAVIFRQIFDGKLDKNTSAFIDLLMRHGREELIPEIALEFLDLYNLAHNRTKVIVESASPLETEQLNALEATIAGQLKTTPLIQTVINPDLIGGFVIKVGTTHYDASVKNQLRKLKKQLS